MRDKIQGIIKQLDKAEKLLIGAIFIVLTAVIFVNVILRWLNLSSFSWLEELSQYGYLCVVFVGTSICVSEKGLSKVSVYRNLPRPIVWVIDFVMTLLAIVLCGYCAMLSARIFLQMAKLGLKTSVLSMPIAFFYGFITVCFAVMTIRFLINLGLFLWRDKFFEKFGQDI